MQKCPLCRHQRNSLDFHHWDYDGDIGVELCRQCHESIHDGLRMSHQENKAKYYGYDGWLERAVKNLITRDIAFLPEEVFNIEERSWSDYQDRIINQYNLPTEAVDFAFPKSDFAYVKCGQMPQGDPLIWNEPE